MQTTCQTHRHVATYPACCFQFRSCICKCERMSYSGMLYAETLTYSFQNTTMRWHQGHGFNTNIPSLPETNWKGRKDCLKHRTRVPICFLIQQDLITIPSRGRQSVAQQTVTSTLALVARLFNAVPGAASSSMSFWASQQAQTWCLSSCQRLELLCQLLLPKLAWKVLVV